MNDEGLIHELTERILSKQKKMVPGNVFMMKMDGNVSATVEAYYSLLYGGYIVKEEERLLATKRFILTHGGIEHVTYVHKNHAGINGTVYMARLLSNTS